MVAVAGRGKVRKIVYELWFWSTISPRDAPDDGTQAMGQARDQNRNCRITRTCKRERCCGIDERELDPTEQVRPQTHPNERIDAIARYRRDKSTSQPNRNARHCMHVRSCKSRESLELCSRMSEGKDEAPVRTQHVDAPGPTCSRQRGQEAEGIFRQHEGTRDLPDDANRQACNRYELHYANGAVASAKERLEPSPVQHDVCYDDGKQGDSEIFVRHLLDNCRCHHDHEQQGQGDVDRDARPRPAALMLIGILNGHAFPSINPYWCCSWSSSLAQARQPGVDAGLRLGTIVLGGLARQREPRRNGGSGALARKRGEHAGLAAAGVRVERRYGFAVPV